MKIIDWLDTQDNIKHYLKIGVLAPEILDAYFTEERPLTRATASYELHKYYPSKQLGKIMQMFAGRGAIGSHSRLRMSGKVKPNENMVVENDFRFAFRAYYEMHDSNVICGAVKLLEKFNPLSGLEKIARTSYESHAFDRLHDFGLLKLEDSKYSLTGASALIFKDETKLVWEELKNWKYRKTFFEKTAVDKND